MPYNNNNYKLLLRQYPQKESNSVAHVVHGLGTHSLGTMQSHQQMIRWSGNLGRKSKFSNGNGKKLCYLIS